MNAHQPSSPTSSTVLEVAASDPPTLVHPGWAREFPWLVQGTTRRGDAEDPFDLGLFSSGSARDEVEIRFESLRRSTDMATVAHARQVHGSEVRTHGDPGGPFVLAEPADGHLTDRPGVLLTVTVADCVPVFVVDPVRRAVAMVHAGWRGVAGGVIESAFDELARTYASSPADLWIHLGPSICGDCYEVGPEVFEALDRPSTGAPRPIDLKAVLAARSVDRGIRADCVSVSAHCTRCTGSRLFSHRGGDAQRQVGYLGIRSDEGPGS